ncbi:sensor histidine kinase [Paenibacillus turpanensis]|uniref:sensor histidine kinase n=1 Tax=Paenibacillus turpanensis TaxID=2689078 RepID=UPI00140A8AFA|nr:histidine kinase [Paenibacillus turpanensis]
MKPNTIKWLILIIPTVTIGVWEYVRHTPALLPYISMETGNLLAPVIVLAVTLTLVLKLFSLWEDIQEQLQEERSLKVSLMERERMARELHDGVAQSLFLLSVKTNKLERQLHEGEREKQAETIAELKKTVHQTNEYVRQAIASLKQKPQPDTKPWFDSLIRLIYDYQEETSVKVHFSWEVDQQLLSDKEKVELYSSIREALINVQKHSDAKQVWIEMNPDGKGWVCRISDDGSGAKPWDAQLAKHPTYGLQIMKERSEELGWSFQFYRSEDPVRTVVEFAAKRG